MVTEWFLTGLVACDWMVGNPEDEAPKDRQEHDVLAVEPQPEAALDPPALEGREQRPHRPLCDRGSTIADALPFFYFSS